MSQVLDGRAEQLALVGLQSQSCFAVGLEHRVEDIHMLVEGFRVDAGVVKVRQGHTGGMSSKTFWTSRE